MDILRNQGNFASLSLRDLLDAREQYHVHLLNKQNVVGTAIGLYLIRKTDPWPTADKSVEDSRNKRKGVRTLANSETRPYSWPCIIVMVNQWIDEDEFGGKYDARQIVPKTLYLPDGRMIPVCVVMAEPAAPAQQQLAKWLWPESAIGGGFPLIIRNQGLERVASVGCLVSDGHTVYALTNRHVCGPAGSEVHTRLRGEEIVIGRSAGLQVSRLPFTEVYPSFSGKRTYLNLDVGLVAVEDARDWTSSVYGLGACGPLADLNEQNLGLQLIDSPVSAFGAASGYLDGRIKALFYRYKSVGGYDYVADLLIAPDANGRQTRPGDSGTVWHLKVTPENDSKEPPSYRPLAVEWGGQTFAMENGAFNFALATNLSNICKLLDVELIADHLPQARPYWGATGHYSIGGAAIDCVTDAKLKKLMKANAERISYDRSDLQGGKINDVLKEAAFVPLADVADVIWKKVPWKVKGGRDPATNVGPEHPVHYADIDIPGPNGGPSLRDLCMQSSSNVDVAVWQQFYDSLGMTKSSDRGLLPFRIWQFFDAMVEYASKGDYLEYVTAAGLVAHYVGDACQTFHGSYLANGYSEQAIETTTSTGNPKKIWPAKGIHTAYETKMIDAKAVELFAGIDKQLKTAKAPKPMSTGHEAAVAIVHLMNSVAKILPPEDICDKYIELGEGTSKPVINGLWDAFGPETAKCMALGILCLAQVWESAWQEGIKVKPAKASDMKQFSEKDIRALYEDVNFVPSLDLDDIGPVLK